MHLHRRHLGRVIPNLCLDDLSLNQHRPRATDSENMSVVLRAALNGELSRTPTLCAFDFDFTTIDSDCWDLLSTNRILTKLSLQGHLGGNTVERIATAMKSNAMWHCEGWF